MGPRIPNGGCHELVQAICVPTFQELVALVNPLASLTDPDETLVFCPTSVWDVYRMPLHALQLPVASPSLLSTYSISPSSTDEHPDEEPIGDILAVRNRKRRLLLFPWPYTWSLRSLDQCPCPAHDAIPPSSQSRLLAGCGAQIRKLTFSRSCARKLSHETGFPRRLIWLRQWCSTALRCRRAARISVGLMLWRIEYGVCIMGYLSGRCLLVAALLSGNMGT